MVSADLWLEALQRASSDTATEDRLAARPELRMKERFLLLNRGVGNQFLTAIVENVGAAPSHCCVVRSFAARAKLSVGEEIPLAEFELRGEAVLTLQPGERRTVQVPFRRELNDGTFMAIVSDPILDPNDLMVADWKHRRVMRFYDFLKHWQLKWLRRLRVSIFGR